MFTFFPSREFHFVSSFQMTNRIEFFMNLLQSNNNHSFINQHENKKGIYRFFFLNKVGVRLVSMIY